MVIMNGKKKKLKIAPQIFITVTNFDDQQE